MAAIEEIRSEQPRASVLSIASIVASMACVGIGNGMMFAYVPFLLAKGDSPPWVAGAAVTALAFGGLAGCVVAGPMIRRVGHARAFSCSMALVLLSAFLIALGFHPLLWVFARGVYGAAGNINFIISLSWLNHASANSWRGKAMSVFYMVYVIAIGLGAWLFGQIPAEGNLAPLLTIFFTTMAILPIGLTRLPNPPPPAKVSVDVPMVWRNSPVAFVGVLAAGGLSMAVQGFTPIYAAANSVSQGDVALLMLVMQFGLIFIQYPMDVLSDRIDRRIVLILVCLLIFGSRGRGAERLVCQPDPADAGVRRFCRCGRNRLLDCQCPCQRSHGTCRFRAARLDASDVLVDRRDDHSLVDHAADAGVRPQDLHLCGHGHGACLRGLRRPCA
jgi:MFS family permease